MAFGSNLETDQGSGESLYQLVVADVNSCNIKIESVSPLFCTPAYPAGSGPAFVNGAFSLRTSLDPVELLENLHKVERAYGRERSLRWGPRTVDLDLIFFNDAILPNLEIWNAWANLSDDEAQKTAPEELIVPHPRAHRRGFVLGPIREIQREFVHPVLHRTVQEIWQGLSEEERAEIQRL